jgi:hypothetical protein
MKEWNGSWKVKRSKESSDQWYGIVYAEFDDGNTEEYRTQPTSYENVFEHIAGLIQKIGIYEREREIRESVHKATILNK